MVTVPVTKVSISSKLLVLHTPTQCDTM